MIPARTDGLDIKSLNCSIKLSCGHDMFRLAEDVYFVSGVLGAVLYDSRNGFIYHLDQEAKLSLSTLLASKASEKSLKGSDSLIRYLINKRLLTTDKSAWDGNIQRLKTNPQITFAWIEITTVCNLKCIHCYEGDKLTQAVEMPIKTYTKIIDELYGYGVRRIQLIGGEPLTAHLLKDFLDYALGKFEFIEVYTNGTLIDQTWVNYFKQNRINVALSVYSYEKKWHEKVTGKPGSWLKTNSAIKMLADAGVKYRVRNVLIKNVPLGCKNTCLYTLNENKDVVRMVGRANANLLSVENIRKRLITKRRFASPVSKKQVARMIGGHNCFANHLYFDVLGDVYPCVMERRMSHGNIHSAHLAQLVKPQILNFNKDCVSECSSCEFRYFCFDCRPDSMGGGISAKPWYCTYHPLTGEWEDVDAFITDFMCQHGLCSNNT